MTSVNPGHSVMLNPEELDDLPELPSGLASDLKNRYGPVPDIPEAIDRAILANSQRHLLQTFPVIAKSKWRWRIAVIGSSMAAACMVFLAFKSQEPQQPANVAHDRGSDRDLDGNGRVDILDAFAIAREIQSGRNQPAFDINGDGRLTQADVTEIAQRAVTL